MMRSHNSRKGSTLVEFTMVGIPLIFLLISVFEMARGMWVYHTLAYSIKDTARFAAVHGLDCSLDPNNCALTVRDIASHLRYAGAGLVPTEFEKISLSSMTRTITCPTLDDCLKAGALGDTYWPTLAPGTSPQDTGSNPGNWILISGQYRFRSAISMFWPGAGPGMVFPVFVLPASSRELIEF